MVPFDQYMAESGRQAELDELRKNPQAYDLALNEYLRTGQYRISFDSFINKWDWKPIDFDGQYGYQCMDLMHQYLKECYGLSGDVLRAPTALQAWLNGDRHFTRVKNTWWNIPQKGDLMFWSGKINGGAGHVAVFKEGNVWSFNSFDQNWPAGTYCHLQKHIYKGVVGWLRKK